MMTQTINGKSVTAQYASESFYEAAVRCFLNTEEGQKNFSVTKDQSGVTITCLWEEVTNNDLFRIVAWCQNPLG